MTLSAVMHLPVDCGYDTPCWVWQRTRNNKGYGVRTVDRRRVLAHRQAWEDAHGPLAEGEQIHHLCGQRACVNPEHLSVTSVAEHNRQHRDEPSLPELLLAEFRREPEQRASELRWVAVRAGHDREHAGVALTRMCRRGEIVRLGHGLYRLAQPSPGAVEPTRGGRTHPLRRTRKPTPNHDNPRESRGGNPSTSPPPSPPLRDHDTR